MLTLLQFFILLCLMLSAISIWWYCVIPPNLPPGPVGLPIFGSMFDTWKAGNLHSKLHEWTKIYGPLYKLYVADKLVLVLGDWHTLHEALVKQGDVYAGRPQVHSLLPDGFDPNLGLMGSEGVLWKEQRRFALSTLRDFGVGRSILEPRIKQEVETLLDEIAKHGGKPFDPAGLLNNVVANVICALVFNRRFDYSQEDFSALLSMLRSRLQESDISLLTPFVLSEGVAAVMAKTPQVKQFKNDRLKVIRFMQREIAKTKREIDDVENVDSFEPSNYVQAFYKAQKQRGSDSTFTDDQLLISVLNLFIAGTDSTSTTIRWALFFLARYPELQEKIREEIRAQTGSSGIPNNADRVKLPLTEATIMEVQRLGNLTPLGVLRRTMAPSKLCGYDIPEGTIVVPLLTAALFDPKTYPDPMKFDPTRFLVSNNGEYKDRFTQFVPFQLGKRVCLGESLARMELFLFLTGLVTRYQFSYSPEDPMPSDAGVASLNRAPVMFKLCAKARND